MVEIFGDNWSSDKFLCSCQNLAKIESFLYNFEAQNMWQILDILEYEMEEHRKCAIFVLYLP